MSKVYSKNKKKNKLSLDYILSSKDYKMIFNIQLINSIFTNKDRIVNHIALSKEEEVDKKYLIKLFVNHKNKK